MDNASQWTYNPLTYKILFAGLETNIAMEDYLTFYLLPRREQIIATGMNQVPRYYNLLFQPIMEYVDTMWVQTYGKQFSETYTPTGEIIQEESEMPPADLTQQMPTDRKLVNRRSKSLAVITGDEVTQKVYLPMMRNLLKDIPLANMTVNTFTFLKYILLAIYNIDNYQDFRNASQSVYFQFTKLWDEYVNSDEQRKPAVSLAKTSSLGSQVSTMEGVSDDDNLQYSRNPPTTAAKTGRIIMKAAGRRTDRSLKVKKRSRSRSSRGSDRTTPPAAAAAVTRLRTTPRHSELTEADINTLPTLFRSLYKRRMQFTTLEQFKRKIKTLMTVFYNRPTQSLTAKELDYIDKFLVVTWKKSHGIP